MWFDFSFFSFDDLALESFSSLSGLVRFESPRDDEVDELVFSHPFRSPVCARLTPPFASLGGISVYSVARACHITNGGGRKTK